jgi:glycosyltransferase involved in cell wall biosynthesis
VPGHVTDIDKFWRSIDVAIFTAPREPLGLRILEAMAAGIPVVSYRTGFGSDELIVDGVTGVQAEWGDAPALARHAVELTQDLAMWQRISTAAARDVRDRFSLSIMCNHLDEVYTAHDSQRKEPEMQVAIGA